MMFGKKPLPLHCENLTEAQIKLAHKVLGGSSHGRMDRLATVAFIQQDGAPERVSNITMAPSPRPTLIEKPVRVVAKTPSGDSP